MTRFDKTDIGCSAIYKREQYEIVDVDEELQLFTLRPHYKPNADTFKARAEDCQYIPF